MMTRKNLYEIAPKNRVFQFGYCEIQTLLKCATKIGCNSGVYGWNWTAYVIDGFVINTGYRNMTGRTIDYRTAREYEEQAKRTVNNAKTYDEQMLGLKELLLEMLYNAL